MLLIYWSLHQLLVQLMHSLHPEEGWEEYPSCPCQTAPTVGTQFRSTPKPHHATSPHWSILFRSAPAETGSTVSGKKEMGTDPVPNPTSLKGRDFFAYTLPSPWRRQGICGTCSRGEFYLWKNRKPLRDWRCSSNPIHLCLKLQLSKAVLP